MLPEQVRVTVVLNTRPGELLADLLPFLGLGSTVTIGRAGAIVASVHEGDQVEQVHLLEHPLILAETAIKRSVRPGSGLRIDDWIATVANAQRYEWLRDRAIHIADRWLLWRTLSDMNGCVTEPCSRETPTCRWFGAD